MEHLGWLAKERHFVDGGRVLGAHVLADPRGRGVKSLNGAQIARIAHVLASAWREEHRENPDAALVLERLAEVFVQRKTLDEDACLALLAQLDVATAAEWELIDELRLAIETRVWDNHPSRRMATAGAGTSAARQTS